MSSATLPPGAVQFGTPSQNVGGAQTIYHIYQVPVAARSARNENSMGFICSHYLLRPFLQFFLWACWIIYISGVSRMQFLCNSGALDNLQELPLYATTTSTYKGGIVLDGTFSNQECVYYLALPWWSVWLQFTALLVLLACTLLSTPRYLNAIMYFLIMSTILLFFIINDFQTSNYLVENKDYPGLNETDWSTAFTLTVVGSVTSAILNGFFIIINSASDPLKKGMQGMAPPPPTTFLPPANHANVHDDKHAKPTAAEGPVPVSTPPAAVEQELASSRQPTTSTA